MIELNYASVSVIIPCYNCVASIDRALASVASQSLRPAEVVLVDDSSTDETLEALYRLQGHYGCEWVRVIELTENGGPGFARNAGWDAATQLYVAFLDSDDSWHKNKIEIQYKWMKANPAVSLTGHACTVILQENQPTDSVLAHFELSRFRNVAATRLLMGNIFPTRSVMLKRDLPQRFLPSKRYSEDYLLWLQIALSGNICCVSNDVLAYTFKPEFGESGLSAQLWKMEMGELDVYRKLVKSGSIRIPVCGVLSTWSLIKYSRRVFVVGIRFCRS